MTDTIFALATPPGRSGVAVVRVSGPASWNSAKLLINKNNISVRQVQLATLRDPSSQKILDRALLLPFKGPASYTGEDCVEYHLHGGPAVTDAVLKVLGAQKGHRMAEPGEFTRRAFENGKLDLTEAEAVADLINAETQAQKIQALSQMEGTLSRLYQQWTETLTQTLAHLEADIEFPDEDIPAGISPKVVETVENLISEISGHLDDNRRGERLRAGLHIAVIGAPNAGKSSLVNALAQRDVAIVSDVEGTTRDVIEVHLDLGGYPVILADTAGLRPDQIGTEGQDLVESEGIRRALVRAQDADLRLLLFDGTQKEPDADTLALLNETAIPIITKCDENTVIQDIPGAIHISVKTEDGLTTFIEALIGRIEALIGKAEAPALTRQRHRAAVEEAQKALKRALEADLPELMAEDIRLAARELGRITGKVDVEDLLDVVFRDFCIGK